MYPLSISAPLISVSRYWQSALDNRLASVDNTLRKDGTEPEPRLVRMQLDLEARAMRSMVSQLHQKLNELAHASTLPSEILQQIFLVLSIHEPVPNATWRTRARESCHWTKVLNVCRKYRQAALACPELWSSPPLGLGSARFNAFMARSQDSPIDLRLESPGDLPATLLCESLQDPEDLARVENALENIHLKELKSDVPKMFNASGPVSVISVDHSRSLLTIVPESSSLTNLQP